MSVQMEYLQQRGVRSERADSSTAEQQWQQQQRLIADRKVGRFFDNNKNASLSDLRALYGSVHASTVPARERNRILTMPNW